MCTIYHRTLVLILPSLYTGSGYNVYQLNRFDNLPSVAVDNVRTFKWSSCSICETVFSRYSSKKYIKIMYSLYIILIILNYFDSYGVARDFTVT